MRKWLQLLAIIAVFGAWGLAGAVVRSGSGGPRYLMVATYVNIIKVNTFWVGPGSGQVWNSYSASVGPKQRGDGQMHDFCATSSDPGATNTWNVMVTVNGANTALSCIIDGDASGNDLNECCDSADPPVTFSKHDTIACEYAEETVGDNGAAEHGSCVIVASGE